MWLRPSAPHRWPLGGPVSSRGRTQDSYVIERCLCVTVGTTELWTWCCKRLAVRAEQQEPSSWIKASSPRAAMFVCLDLRMSLARLQDLRAHTGRGFLFDFFNQWLLTFSLQFVHFSLSLPFSISLFLFHLVSLSLYVLPIYLPFLVAFAFAAHHTHTHTRTHTHALTHTHTHTHTLTQTHYPSYTKHCTISALAHTHTTLATRGINT